MSLSGWNNNIITYSPLETEAVAEQFAKILSAGALVLLKGDLGAGKTTFVKGLAKGLKITSECIVQSPTFTYLHIYEGEQGPLYHFDLYRMTQCEEFLSQGFDDFLFGEAICCVEWPERIEKLLTPPYWEVQIVHKDIESREFRYRYYG